MSSSALLPPVPTKADQVYENIRERILDGSLAPGARLSMDAIAKELGVSKIPVREAIGRLESQRLVVNRPHAGPTVATVNVTELEGVYLARQQLEPMMTRLAATRIDADGIRALAKVHTRMRTAVNAGRIGELGALNSQFHSLIALASGYSILEEFETAMLLAIRRHRVVEPLDLENWHDVVDEHGAILRALEAHDADAAAAAADSHVVSQGSHDATVSEQMRP
jgi:DNA-binding GntR family transcriptional regulator